MTNLQSNKSLEEYLHQGHKYKQRVLEAECLHVSSSLSFHSFSLFDAIKAFRDHLFKGTVSGGNG